METSLERVEWERKQETVQRNKTVDCLVKFAFICKTNNTQTFLTIHRTWSPNFVGKQLRAQFNTIVLNSVCTQHYQQQTHICVAYLVFWLMFALIFSISVFFCLNIMTTIHVWPMAWSLITVAKNMLLELLNKLKQNN